MNIVAFMKDQEAASIFKTAATTARSGKIDVYVSEGGDPLTQREIINGHDVLFYDLECSDQDDTNRLARFIKEDNKGRPIIVTAKDATPDDVRQLLNLGVVDVLTHPIRETDLIIALDHAERALVPVSRAEPPKGKVISFLKGGGGAGATTLAVQGGALLATGDKKGARNVCLMDLDIQFGTAGLYLDLESKVGLEDLLEGADRLDGSLLKSAMTHHDSGLDVLTAPKNVLPLETVAPEFVSSLLQVSREIYDVTILDLPQAWTSWSYTALSQSDAIVVVSQLTVSSIRQAVQQVQTLTLQDLSDIPVKHVLNRYRRSGFMNSAELRDAEKALGRKYDYRVSNDYELVGESLNRGVMLGKIQKRSKTGKDIREMMFDLEKFVFQPETESQMAVAV